MASQEVDFENSLYAFGYSIEIVTSMYNNNNNNNCLNVFIIVLYQVALIHLLHDVKLHD